MRAVLLSGIGILLTLAGCAASGPAFIQVDEVPEQKALVYIYRRDSFVGGAISYTVHAGDEEIVNLKRGGYFPYLADPGETEFWASTEARTSVTQMLEAGKTYYLQGDIGVGILAGRPKLNFVSESIGTYEISECKLLNKAE